MRETLAGKIRLMANVLASMGVEADSVSSIESTWNAIREFDMEKKIEIFVDRAKATIKRWLENHMPGVAKAISVGTDGNVSLTPSGELVSKDRRIRIKI